jgi:copper chaperone CopZ
MKKLFFSLLALGFLSTAAHAQTKALETAKISTPSVQCEMCKNRIEQYLKRIDGVTSVNVNFRNKTTTVKYLTDRTNIEMIKTSIANAGYDVAKTSDDNTKPAEIEIAANPDSYKLLPKCCKKPEDGGGMPKQ